MAVLALRRPNDPLVHVAVGQVDAAIQLFSQVIKYRQRPTITSNLAWLLRIRQKIGNRFTTDNTSSNMINAVQADLNDTDDADLVGLQTRLVERAVMGVSTSKARSVPDIGSLANLGSGHAMGLDPTLAPDHFSGNGEGGGGMETNSTVAFTTPDTTADLFVSRSNTKSE
jgi:hypothetical protein